MKSKIVIALASVFSIAASFVYSSGIFTQSFEKNSSEYYCSPVRDSEKVIDNEMLV